MLKLNIGCYDVLLNGWENIDLYQRNGAIQHDARTRFNYANESVDFVFSEHFIEHLNETESDFFFKEMYRVLKPGGVIRTATFDIDDWLIGLSPNNKDWTKFRDELYGGMFSHYKTRIELLHLAIYDTDYSHKYMYNVEESIKKASRAGFSKFNTPKMRESEYPELQNLEWRCNSNCIVEAVK